MWVAPMHGCTVCVYKGRRRTHTVRHTQGTTERCGGAPRSPGHTYVAALWPRRSPRRGPLPGVAKAVLSIAAHQVKKRRKMDCHARRAQGMFLLMYRRAGGTSSAATLAPVLPTARRVAGATPAAPILGPHRPKIEMSNQQAGRRVGVGCCTFTAFGLVHLPCLCPHFGCIDLLLASPL